MSQIAELHLLKQRIQELEETVEIIDKGRIRQEEKYRDSLIRAAMQGILSNSNTFSSIPDTETLVSIVNEIADAILAKRNTS